MKIKTKKKLCFAFVLVFFFALVGSFVYYGNFVIPALTGSEAVNGCTDLSGVSFDSGERAFLRGDWDFFYNRFLISGEDGTSQPDMYAHVPSSWTAYELNGSKLTNGGYASYRLRISGVNSELPVIVCVPNLAAAYRAYIDGVLVYSSGQISSTPEFVDSRADYYESPVVLNTSEDGSYEVVIEVACRYTDGLKMTPIIMNVDDYHAYNYAVVGLRYIFVGAMFLTAMFAFILYRYLKREKHYIWLSVLCIVLAFRMMMSSEGFFVLQSIAPDLGYEMMQFFIYISTFIAKLLLLLYVTSALPVKISSNMTVIFCALFLSYSFIPYFIEENIYDTASFLFLQFSTFALDAVMIYKLSAAAAEKVRGAWLYLSGYVFVVAGLYIDVLYTSGLIVARMSIAMPVMFVVFLLCTALVHAQSTADKYRAMQKNARLSEEVTQLNTALMLSQIQPHFLYNALNAIKYLTRKDPKQAESAVVNFSNYLRTNMDSLTQKTPVPFTKELEHIKNYVGIEQIRFAERLEIVYDIECTDFTIPPLTIQPLVENAIKHGVNQKPEGGTVTLKTYESANCYFVEVLDDGVGFTVGEKKDDGRSHVGIENITSRLSSMLGASLDIISAPGKGTKAIVKIPKGRTGEQ